ncbi:hypothetical protein EDB19DRAFT_179124 [Suillus lakei]|nr:hypothetical protein EDB19DRAFT_179124 [Suillus lakei]
MTAGISCFLLVGVDLLSLQLLLIEAHKPLLTRQPAWRNSVLTQSSPRSQLRNCICRSNSRMHKRSLRVSKVARKHVNTLQKILEYHLRGTPCRQTKCSNHRRSVGVWIGVKEVEHPIVQASFKVRPKRHPVSAPQPKCCIGEALRSAADTMCFLHDEHFCHISFISPVVYDLCAALQSHTRSDPSCEPVMKCRPQIGGQHLVYLWYDLASSGVASVITAVRCF